MTTRDSTPEPEGTMGGADLDFIRETAVLPEDADAIVLARHAPGQPERYAAFCRRPRCDDWTSREVYHRRAARAYADVHNDEHTRAELLEAAEAVLALELAYVGGSRGGGKTHALSEIAALERTVHNARTRGWS